MTTDCHGGHFRNTAFLGVAALLFVLAASVVRGSEQEFRLSKPEAQSVSVAGEFNEWHAQAMNKQADGSWALKISISPGSYGYKFLIDEKDWIFDPK